MAGAVDGQRRVCRARGYFNRGKTLTRARWRSSSRQDFACLHSPSTLSLSLLPLLRPEKVNETGRRDGIGRVAQEMDPQGAARDLPQMVLPR
jgi:hypothetical protein